jgi:hypothetical protein
VWPPGSIDTVFDTVLRCFANGVCSLGPVAAGDSGLPGGIMRFARWLVVVGALLAILPKAHADDPIGRISIGGSGGISFYGLKDVNDRIEGDGNDFLSSLDWTELDALRLGWAFWGDLKVKLPLGDLEIPVPFTDSRLPVDLYLGGGVGTSSGVTGGKDYNELIEVEAAQQAFHIRLLYALPWRIQEDTRLFVGGGPLIISEQKVTATHTHRSVTGGTSSIRTTERTEEVSYTGDGLGWQLGMAAEYMIQDRMTLVLDLTYRWANVEYGSWSSESDLHIADTDPVDFGDGSTSLERLQRERSYVFHGFLDWEETEERERALGLGNELHEYGPYIGPSVLVPLRAGDLGIDLSGFQIHAGFRLYFL